MALTRTHKIAFGIVILAATNLFIFQNCSRVNFKTLSPSSEEFLSMASITINNGDSFTKDVTVKLQLRSKHAKEMYISNDSTCETGGSWETFRDERLWRLGQENTRATVYAKFKTEYGVVLPCIDASIVHDNIAPTVEIVTGPKQFENTMNADFTFRGEDAGSGIDYFECQTAAGTYERCDTPKTLTNLPEGNHEFTVRVVDNAGNVSQPDKGDWMVDVTAPTIQFTETPPAVSTQSTAVFRFEAEDTGSGIETIYCQLDTAMQAGTPQKDCSSPAVLNDLASGMTEVQYRFWVWAFDRAGNQSDKIFYDFIVDRQPSGDFQILGVTGGTDTKIDDLLGTVANPTIHWTTSSSAERYRVSVLNEAGTATVCPERTTNKGVTTYAYSAADCTLTDNMKYKAKVVAEDINGNTRAAPLFTFRVDISPPTIKITGPIQTNDDKDAEFEFEITDVSGVDSATCLKNMKNATTPAQQANCKDKTDIKYVNLVPGDHTFQIVATDNAGNSGSSVVIPWTVNLIVCDPFSSVEQKCRKGLKGNLWYLTQEQRKAPFKTVEKYISDGILAKVIIYMSQLAIPTSPWTAGFKATDGTVVRTDEGEVLYEYFAMRFETLVKLDPAKNPAGKYQFAILSDDGSIVEIKNSPTGPYTTFINNDGDHPTRLGCSSTGIEMTNTTRIPMAIKYYQGPRYHIALKLLWRPLPTNAADVNDPFCGVDQKNEFYYGDTSKAAPDLVNYGYGELVKRGWKPLEPNNFILAEEDK